MIITFKPDVVAAAAAEAEGLAFQKPAGLNGAGVYTITDGQDVASKVQQLQANPGGDFQQYKRDTARQVQAPALRSHAAARGCRACRGRPARRCTTAAGKKPPSLSPALPCLVCSRGRGGAGLQGQGAVEAGRHLLLDAVAPPQDLEREGVGHSAGQHRRQGGRGSRCAAGQLRVSSQGCGAGWGRLRHPRAPWV